MVLVACYRCNRYHRIVPLGNMLSHYKGIVLKSSRPSLPLKKAPPLTPALFNGLYTPFGSPVCGGTEASGAREETALRCSEPLRSKVGGPSKVTAKLCGLGPPGETQHNIINPALCLRNIG